MSIHVACAIIEDPTHSGRYLVTQRPEDTHLALKWEFPGGKIKIGENPRVAIKREIKEELGIIVAAQSLLAVNVHSYEEIAITLHAWYCNYLSGNIKRKGIRDYAWKTPIEMRDIDMAEADLPFINLLI